MEGIVKKWMMSYGFIGAEGMDKDIFVHQSDVKSGSMLREGQKVKFDVKDEPKGPKAVNVEVIE
ncbi:MAG: cold-shock protein [Thermoplasmata archaeon]|nr:cold shock domain-containing protein [Thermoplasmata archaeon]RLF47283.1 MAG: cold-shock protein [Thermoplasmata archaeon]RLF63900.1 MAG: cold-shock protein [Thermoplasmata archaeon]